MADKTSPDSQLRLQWVYGYRGHQCRNNLYYTATGEVVYFVAGVGVVYNATEGQQRFYLEHTDDIISLALHPDKGLVATAQTGKAPFICVWDCVTMETVSILQGGHERGIAALGFSGNGNLLASVGLDDNHSLNVWDWRKGKVVASTRGHSDRIFDVQFNPHTTGSLVTCGVKHIKFWTLSGNTLTGKKGIFGKKGELQSVLCAAFCSAEVTITGTLSGDLYKWSGHNLASVVKGAHTGAIYCLYGSGAGFATGSRDGAVRLWDSDLHPITTLNIAAMTIGYKGLCVRSVCWAGEKVLVGTKDSEVVEVTVQDKDNPTVITQGHTEGELWALTVHPTQPVFATGSDDKSVRVWSMRDHSVLSRCHTPHPVRSLAFSPDGSHLAAGMQDGSFSVLDAGSLSQVAHVKKRKEVLHEMKFSPDGRYLAVGSNDNFVDVYSAAEAYKHVGTCSGSSSFITHLDWSVDSQYIQTNSGASERLYFQMPSGKRITSKEEVQAIQWATWTSVLGAEVNGIWAKYSQVNDVNATDAVFEHRVIATGDDFGLVKLFRFPCVKKGAKFKKYVGHSAHVINVRFSHDHRHLVSVGGADHAVFQWNFLSGEEGEEGEGGTFGGGASDSEESDSDMSDAASLDSELEREQEKNYDRTVYREDLQKLKDKLQERERVAEKEAGGVAAVAAAGVKGRSSSSSSSSAAAARRGRKTGPPEDSLRLEFVHGYRGYDCRNNLYYTQDGRIVYHIAALGIVYDRQTHSQKFYSAHTDDILSLALHPSHDYVATGQIGRDPAIHVWDAGSLSTLSILQGEHSRGVCAVGFSADGKKLASVGLDNEHSIVVWDWMKGEKLATTRGHKDKIFLLSWNPSSADQLVTVGVKHIKFWKQAGGGFTSKRGIFGKVGKSGTMLSLAFSAEGDRCFSGGADGKIYHWIDNSLTAVMEAHKGPVFAMQRVEKGYVSGGKDGAVCLWNESFQNRLKTYHLQSDSLEGGARLTFDLPAVRALCLGQGKVLVGTKNSEILEIEKSGQISLLIQGHMEGEAWGLSTHPTQPLCVSASDDGTARFWDLAGHRQTAVLSVPGRKARAVGYSHDGSAVAVGFMDGGFIVVSADTLEQITSFHHRTQEISDVKFSPNGKYLAVASHDNFVDIYNIQSKKRVGICKGASSYITHVDWDERGKLLQLNTGDREVLYYEAPRGKQQYISQDDAAELEWSTWTCILGDSCTGIWPAYTDVTDVNTASRSRDSQVIATGDDFGLVKLFTYPSYEKHAKCKQYVGHSAHVTHVSFSHDDRKLVSLGGADMSLMVWSHSAGSRDPAPTAATTGDHQSDPSSMTSLGYLSEESDTDSEEEGGYDSDVEREKKMDYQSKIYAAPIREAGAGIKPHLQEDKPAADPDSRKRSVRRSVAAVASRVVTREEGSRVDVKDLSLDFIFGYRGFDTRHNLLYTADGLVVYPAAGAGVVYNPLTRQQSFYLEHNDDIICVALNRNHKLSQVVATGQLGKTAAIHVWDCHTKQTLSILQGAHAVGVSSVDFSCNGKLLLSVGLNSKHSITVWRWAEGSKVAQTSGDKRRVFLAQFRPDSDTQFVSCGVKHVRFWNLAGTRLLSQRGSLPKTCGASMQTMLSLAFAQDNTTFTGSINGDVYVWKGSILSRVVSRAHSGPVFAMFTCLEDGLIVSAGKEMSGGRDVEGAGEVKLWSADMAQSRSVSLGMSGSVVVRSVCRSKGKILVGTQNNEILEIEEKSGQVQTPIRGHGEGELWGLAVHPAALSFVTASEDKTVRLWSLSDKTVVCQKQLDHAARSADFSPDGSQVAVGLCNGEFLVLSATDLNLVGRRRDRSRTIAAIRFSPDGGRVAVGSDDACVDIYSLSPLVSRVGYCRGIPSFVTQMDWSQDGKFLQISTGVYERLVFEVASGKQITSSDVINKITWASWTSVLGDEVIGVWPKNADKADVNTAHLNHSGTAVATGDDFGCLKLFTQFPLSEKFAPHKKYFGHSAHVTNVKFTHDDQYVLSAGGDDSCVFVWKCAH